MKNQVFVIFIFCIITFTNTTIVGGQEGSSCSLGCGGFSYLKQQSISLLFQNLRFNAILSNDSKTLALTIIDFQNWILYAKQFKEADIGGSINKNFDLSFIFQSIAAVHEKIQGPILESILNNTLFSIPKYTYGTVFKINNISYFKIEQGGILTMYRTVIELNKNKTKFYQSKIELPAVRNMTYSEKSRQRYLMYRLQRDNQTNQQIQLLKQKNENLTKQIQSLSSGNTSPPQNISQINLLKNQIAKLKKKQPFYGEANSWKAMPGLRGVMLEVSYKTMNLTKTPKIFTSLSGDRIWMLTGINAIYNADYKGFEVYIYGKNLTEINEPGTDAVLHYQIVPQEDN